MAIIYLALGANVGDTTKNLDQAIQLLKTKVSDIEEAPRYRSRAVGFTDQPDFVNTAVKGQTSLEPLELLQFVKSIEAEVGRISRFRWGPREIDIDIIFYDDLILNTEVLQIPHARFAERDFVLKPVFDLAPDLVDPVSGKTVSVLYNNLPDTDKAIEA